MSTPRKLCVKNVQILCQPLVTDVSTVFLNCPKLCPMCVCSVSTECLLHCVSKSVNSLSTVCKKDQALTVPSLSSDDLYAMTFDHLLSPPITQYLSDTDEILNWLSDMEKIVQTEDLGKDEATAQLLLKKHKVYYILFL